ncbi:MAG TPA: hypothetical protein VFN10_01865 [Thermoanaerobaculia bacterium]|nr:hypothetical protein [Thermoanaerobaculia bacterium]
MGRFEPVHAHTASTTNLPPWLATFVADAREWCEGRTPWARALLLVYLVYAEIRFLRDPLSGTIFSGITLAFHEMGHIVFGFAGHFIGSFMGSGMQLLIPVVVVILFLRQGDYFGMAVGGFWLSFAMFELANYIGDAREQELPLVSYSAGDPEHDWNYLLGTMHLLAADKTLAFLTRVVATGVGAASLAFAVWLLLTMWRSRRTRGFAR